MLVLVLVAIGTVLLCRARRRRSGGPRLPMRSGADDEESIPLSGNGFGIGRGLSDSAHTRANGGTTREKGKGKERERLLGADETVFEVGESEDERSDRGH